MSLVLAAYRYCVITQIISVALPHQRDLGLALTECWV